MTRASRSGGLPCVDFLWHWAYSTLQAAIEAGSGRWREREPPHWLYWLCGLSFALYRGAVPHNPCLGGSTASQVAGGDLTFATSRVRVQHLALERRQVWGKLDPAGAPARARVFHRQRRSHISRLNHGYHLVRHP